MSKYFICINNLSIGLTRAVFAYYGAVLVIKVGPFSTGAVFSGNPLEQVNTIYIRKFNLLNKIGLLDITDRELCCCDANGTKSKGAL